MVPFRMMPSKTRESRSRACLALATALCSLLFPQPGGATGPARYPDALVRELEAWIARDTGLPLPAEMPRIAFAGPRQLNTLFHGETATGAAAGAGDVIALYDSSEHTILLPEHWTGATPAEVSVLVHELVHHMQAAAGRRYACPGEREAPAYRAQADWLAQTGSSLERDFGIDDFFLKAVTICWI